MDLPRTDFEKFRENPVFRRFVGRVKLEYAAAWLHYQKGGVVQKLMHEIKYRDRPDLAVYLGELLAKEWQEADILKEPDLIVPVPLHPRKRRRRGYNQSEQIAIGLARGSGASVETDQLYRHRYRQSQTRQHRFERWQQVKCDFSIRDPDRFAAKHILLVDDVVTTGATLEACVQALSLAPDTRYSILCLAHA